MPITALARDDLVGTVVNTGFACRAEEDVNEIAKEAIESIEKAKIKLTEKFQASLCVPAPGRPVPALVLEKKTHFVDADKDPMVVIKAVDQSGFEFYTIVVIPTKDS